jgi:hypothetical protein
VTGPSADFAPAVQLFAPNGALLRTEYGVNSTVSVRFAGSAGSTYRIRVAPRSSGGRTVASGAPQQGASAAGGSWAYRIAVNALRQFDQFEPNDSFDSATPILAGATLEANIMDPDDDDFYRVAEPLARLRLQPQSNTLALIVSLYSANFTSSYLRTHTERPGTPIELTMLAGVTRIKVESESGGTYTLAIE